MFQIALCKSSSFPFFELDSSYVRYYDMINRAELKIADCQFDSAFIIYCKIFDRYEMQEKNDVFNASLCAIHAGQMEKAAFWIKKSIAMGLELEDFQTKTFKKLPEEYWENIKYEYRVLHMLYIANYDSLYKSIFDTLRIKEQELVHFGKKRYDSLLYENTKVIYDLIKNRGIPNIGMFDGQKLPLDVMRHHFGLRNQLKCNDIYGIDLNSEPYKSMDIDNYNIEQLLINAVYRGEISPHFVSICMAHSECDSSRQLGTFQVFIDFNKRTIVPDYLLYDTSAVNAYRRYLGLETVNDAMKKNYEVALLYNPTKFPFDDYLRKFKEIGYSKSIVEKLNEKDKAAKGFECVLMMRDMKRKYLGYIKSGKNKDIMPVNIGDKGAILLEFRLEHAQVSIVYDPPNSF